MKENSYTNMNSKMWDQWALDGGKWSTPITHEEFQKAEQGESKLYLTPCKLVPNQWLIPLKGKKVLGLASGGGQQCPIFAAQQADVTVFDNSKEQLALEELVARREGYSIDLIKGDMTQPLPFAEDQFDFIFHPVSNCYIHDVTHLWREAYRVLKKGGVLLAAFANPAIYLFSEEKGRELEVVNRLPYDGRKQSQEELIEFSHSLETQIGGQLKAGFQLKDLYEDHHHEGILSEYMPCYIATRAVK
ncbi:Methyltransferase domain-containing protein [Seinonella peptonophila]|uniref:Methyltransferase domain-containing protein n=1 Tax=Seinonella peptonophila TaxID=112248 RepID=A0A1M4X3X1_9BACL|nr:class I SAM-dependent methyltransferase [Seinonella peptonophila]SHE88176.1 Methyltransferase domain-containing protein [Seinonella peptonophila]